MSKTLLCLFSCALLTGCAGDTMVNVPTSTKITKGQELADLQRALDAGAVSEREYRRLREALMDRPY